MTSSCKQARSTAKFMNPRRKEILTMPPRPNGPRLSMKESMKQLDKKTLFRLLSYMKPYRLHLVFVFICIAVSAFASVMSSLFLKSLIDDYISPLLLESNPNFSGLLYALLQMAVIYVIGAFSTLFYNRTMAVVSQGTLKKIRDEMFEHMQTLPIRYFDTHTHGDIMSHYTNDTDTLRQMLA
ncbi:MAG TPA: ABC transporter, partial [Ruminococcaceae bacterium]|nr:ABC transporter [Oscillospiraceae bacterium]